MELRLLIEQSLRTRSTQSCGEAQDRRFGCHSAWSSCRAVVDTAVTWNRRKCAVRASLPIRRFVPQNGSTTSDPAFANIGEHCLGKKVRQYRACVLCTPQLRGLFNILIKQKSVQNQYDWLFWVILIFNIVAMPQFYVRFAIAYIFRN